MRTAPLILTVLTALAAPGVQACSSGSSSDGGAPVEHPLLVVRADDYAAIRARAATPGPLRDLAQAALRYAQDETFDPGASLFDAKTRMTDLCGALALAWILDPRPAFLAKLRDTLDAWPAFFAASAPSGQGLQVRWRQSAMLMTIVALDVMGPALAPAELAAYENMLDGMVRQWWALLPQDGTTSTPGIATVWALYSGDRGLLASARALYLQRLFDALAPSGVYSAGPGYAWVRHGGDRISKYGPIDVLEHTGEAALYTDPRLVGLYEWMFAGALTPRRRNTTFGDSDPTRTVEGLFGYMQPYGAGRLSAQAGRNAAWLVQGVEPRPLLTNFVLMEDPPPTPEPPRSQVWGDAATFWEDAGSPDSLMGALWSPRASASHSHKDVNAVHLYAYGRNVLRNSGYCGSGVGIDTTFDWEWVNDTAESSNTLTLGGVDHASKRGGGIQEGLTSDVLDYAAAAAGPALADGQHVRSLLLVHGAPGAPGYFVLADEVRADVPGTEARLVLHPDATTLTPTVPDTELVAQVDPAANLDVTLFLGTPPLSTAVLDGGLCAFDDEDYVGRYLEARYPTGAAGELGIVTVVAPHDPAHPKPALQREVLAGAWSGARVTLGASVVDTVLESHGNALVTPLPESFRGRLAWWRRDAGTFSRYLVRRGRAFDDGATNRTGFESDVDVTVLVAGTAARVVNAARATVTFHEPALTGVAISGPDGVVLDAQPGLLTIRLEPGRHAFDLATGARL